MSNIFNLLGGIADSDRSQAMNSFARSKTSHEIRLHKSMGGAKPKGLSIRSNSDMNISQSTHSASAKKSAYDSKEQDCLKLKVTQIDNNGRPISPGRKTPVKKLIGQPSTFKEPLQEDTFIKDMKIQKALNDDVFKKPFPKKNIKKLREPEKLTYWYDAQEEFDHAYIYAAEKEFKKLFNKGRKNIEPKNEEKKFHKNEKLHLEVDTLVELPVLLPDKSPDEKFSFAELPEISDISDIDDLQ